MEIACSVLPILFTFSKLIHQHSLLIPGKKMHWTSNSVADGLAETRLRLALLQMDNRGTTISFCSDRAHIICLMLWARPSFTAVGLENMKCLVTPISCNRLAGGWIQCMPFELTTSSCLRGWNLFSLNGLLLIHPLLRSMQKPLKWKFKYSHSPNGCYSVFVLVFSMCTVWRRIYNVADPVTADTWQS